MSSKGTWGDMLIVVLKSDGIRRHKKWCKHYEEGYCNKLCGKCIGSAHCEYYQNEITEQAEYVYANEEQQEEIKKGKKTDFNEVFVPATRTDKLLDKVILIRNTPYTFRIGVVTYEDFYKLEVKYNGKIHKYDKRKTFEHENVYVMKETYAASDNDSEV